jgi:hypothetical protein
MFGRRCHARNQAAAADRYGQNFEVWNLFEHFQRHRALTGHDVIIIERMHKYQIAFVTQLGGKGGGIVIGFALQHDLGAMRAGMLDLHKRRALGHDNGGGNAQTGGVIG